MPRKASVLPGPCIPHPTTPRVTRSEAPKTEEGMMVGAANAKLVAARKRRRLMPVLRSDFFIKVMTPDCPTKFEQKNRSSFGTGTFSRASLGMILELPWEFQRSTLAKLGVWRVFVCRFQHPNLIADSNNS